jgi:hypothetical protein
MKDILSIFNELDETNSTKIKEQTLLKYKDDELLKKVIYLALSPRVKFYIKKIPQYESIKSFNEDNLFVTLEESITKLSRLSSREVTGSNASLFLKQILENVTTNDAIVIERIIGKDLKIGLNKSTVNKVWKKHIESTPYMGAIAFNKKKAQNIFKDKNGVVSQVKMDGRYANLISAGNITLESRDGEITYLNDVFDDIFTDVEDNFVLNGELTIDGIPRYISNGIIASVVSINKKLEDGKSIVSEMSDFIKKHGMTVQEATDKIVFTVWDMITIDEYREAKSNRIYQKRLDELEFFLAGLVTDKIRLIESKRVYSYEEAILDFKTKLSAGEEGTIIKGLSCIWKDGKPNEQIKLKIEFSVDLKIIGFNQGKPGTRIENTLGSLITESDCKLLQTDPGGITDDMRKYIWDNRDSLLDTYVEVTCSGLSVTEDGYSLLHPRFSKLRDDKNTGDTVASIKLIEEGLKTID